MEAKRCDINHSDADVLLPPRKRLLGGFKKQNFDVSSHMALIPRTSNEFDTRLNNLLKSHKNNSLEEIVEASRLAFEDAIKVAKAKRAFAEKKAVIAAKAMAAAKSALDFVVTSSEEKTSRDKVGIRENTLKLDKFDQLKTKNGEALRNYSKRKMREGLEDPFGFGRKRGRIKQKKLPLSVCNIRDQASPKDIAGNNKPLISGGTSSSSVMPIEMSSTWKCKVFKGPKCVKQNKIVQS